MEQAAFAELEHDSRKRRTRRELFPERMDALVPRDRLARRIEPFHPKGGKRKLLDRDGPKAAERRKGSARAKAEHPFPRVKRRFGGAKVRCRGLTRNTQRIALPLGFSNLPIAGRHAPA